MINVYLIETHSRHLMLVSSNFSYLSFYTLSKLSKNYCMLGRNCQVRGPIHGAVSLTVLEASF